METSGEEEKGNKIEELSKVEPPSRKNEIEKTLRSALFKNNKQLYYSLNRGTKFDNGQGHYIGEGSTGDYVILIQKALNLIYKDQPGYEPLKEEKDFGPKTKAAVSEFQKDYGLKGTNGVVGPETIEKLDALIFKIETMSFDENELFAIELINEAIRKRRPNDANAIKHFWNWYHSLEKKPSFNELADYVQSVDFSYLNSNESRVFMTLLSSGAATMLSLAGRLNKPDAMQQLIDMTEGEKQQAFARSTEETIAILLMEFATGKGEEIRIFTKNHQMTKDLMKSTTTAFAYEQFYNEIKDGKVKEGVVYRYVQGYHNRAKTTFESVRIHANSILNARWGEFFRGGMEYFFTIKGKYIMVKATDKYTPDSGIRNKVSFDRLEGFETPFGTTYVEYEWKVPVKDVLLDFKGLDYYNKK